MSEKKAKAERKEEPRLLNTIEFRIMSDGRVPVSGPIHDPAFALDIIGTGIKNLAQFYRQENKSQIIKPNADMIQRVKK